jgi:2-dehydro-3-deoxyphosphogluconate aldolase/(4S)-4-hydroxy-2-oxoglutarate aldolase
VPVACGTFTPTEALAAHRAGADFVKLFPAENLGPSYVRSILGPLPFLKIMPTGGVTPQSIPGFIRAGCVAVAAGSSLVSNGILHAKDWALLARVAKDYVDALASARVARRE